MYHKQFPHFLAIKNPSNRTYSKLQLHSGSPGTSMVAYSTTGPVLFLSSVPSTANAGSIFPFKPKYTMLQLKSSRHSLHTKLNMIKLYHQTIHHPILYHESSLHPDYDEPILLQLDNLAFLLNRSSPGNQSIPSYKMTYKYESSKLSGKLEEHWEQHINDYETSCTAYHVTVNNLVHFLNIHHPVTHTTSSACYVSMTGTPKKSNNRRIGFPNRKVGGIRSFLTPHLCITSKRLTRCFFDHLQANLNHCSSISTWLSQRLRK